MKVLEIGNIILPRVNVTTKLATHKQVQNHEVLYTITLDFRLFNFGININDFDTCYCMIIAFGHYPNRATSLSFSPQL